MQTARTVGPPRQTAGVSSSCAAAHCDRPVHARGHCARHYRQLLRHGEVQSDPVPERCAVPACGRTAVTRGWCHGHYLRWRRTGDVAEDRPLVRARAGTCGVVGCAARRKARGLCQTHLARLTATGDVRPAQPVRSPGTEGWITHGYRGVAVPEELRHLVGGAAQALEHRLVMALVLDRPLLAHEVVHHRNGDRLDNRPANLELWSTTQPKGQRVQDKLAWAYQMLIDYAPDVAQALGLLDDVGGRTDDSHLGDVVTPGGFEPPLPP